jgi:hypothetical protein
MNNRAVYLHIGHHRTGTTFLQKRVFSKIDHLTYYHKDETTEAAKLLGAFRMSTLIWKTQGDALLRPFSKSKKPSVISSEELSCHRLFLSPEIEQRRDPCQLAAHVRGLRAAAARYDLKVRIIVGIRRQDGYLCSRYANLSDRIESASQADFERQVRDILNMSSRYFIDGVWLDFENTAQMLAEAVGANNLLILALEQLSDQPTAYLNVLSGFLDLPIPKCIDPAVVNARSEAENIWRLKRERYKFTGRLVNPLMAALGKQPGTISLPEDLKSQVMHTYGQSNRKLAKHVSADLGRYGYF